MLSNHPATQQVSVRGPRAAESGLIALFGGCTVLFAAYPVWRIFYPIEIDRNEAWNAYHVDSILTGLPLYPAADALIVNNYPPLSFYLVAALSYFASDVIIAGRILSVVAILGIGACIFGCVRAFNGSYRGALIGALWFVAVIVHNFPNYAGMNDPQLLALFIMAGAFLWFVRRVSAKEDKVAPFVLMAAAGFFKHNIIAIPAASVAWLVLTEGRSASRPIAALILATGFGLAVCFISFGPVFLDNLLMPRVFSWGHFVYRLPTIQWVAPAVILCALGLYHNRSTGWVRMIRLLFVTSSFSFLLQSWGEGVNENAMFEMVFALAIAVGFFFDRFPNSRLRSMPIVIMIVLLLRLLLSPALEDAAILVSPQYRGMYARHAEVFAAEVTRIRSLEGNVSCSVMSVCRRAGKPFVYDAFYVSELLKTRNFVGSQIERVTRERNINFESIDVRTTIVPLQIRTSNFFSMIAQ